jgi:hypothetical protein
MKRRKYLNMKTSILIAALCAIFCGGCASNQQTQAKKIFERPWVGGKFKSVPTAASVRADGRHFGKRGALLTSAYKETPLEKAGLQEADVVLAVNGTKVDTAKKIFDATGSSQATFTIYRNGEILEKAVQPGIERYEKYRSVALAFSLSPRIEFDLLPNPDFSLFVLGFKRDQDRLQLRDVKSKYLRDIEARDGKAKVEGDWKGLRSEEGWKFWVGPIWIDERKMIVAQE